MTTLEGDRPDLGAPADEEALAADWHEALNRYHRTTCALDRALSHDHGITVSDFEVLQQLHGARCMVKMQDLADQVHLTQSALSRLITRLEKAQLVTRGTCEDDRRAVWTQITAAGSACYLAARPTQRAVLRDIAAGGSGSGCIPEGPAE
jgi:DNA-binding MarR family transcriptional regulator